MSSRGGLGRRGSRDCGKRASGNGGFLAESYGGATLIEPVSTEGTIAVPVDDVLNRGVEASLALISLDTHPRVM